MWAPSNEPFAVYGGSIGSLTKLSKLKAVNSNLAVAKELAWRQAARRWIPVPAHKLVELNLISDAVSRREAEGKEKKPVPQYLALLPRAESPVVDSCWHCWAPIVQKQAKARRAKQVHRKRK